MNRFSLTFVLLSTAFVVVAQNSAPSSHFVFDDRFDGDIVINEVRVPKSGEAMYTYYEALGWRAGRLVTRGFRRTRGDISTFFPSGITRNTSPRFEPCTGARER